MTTSGIPRIRYFHSSDNSIVPFTNETLSMPMSTDRPDSTPPSSESVTYKQYMEFIKTFLVSRWEDFINLLGLGLGEKPTLVLGIDIVAEKSGSDYHPASIRFLTNQKTISFVANVAITSRGRSRLQQDFELIEYFHDQGMGSFLPKPFFISASSEFIEAEKADSMVLFVGEWLDEFYEFHLTRLDDQEELSVVIWDIDNGMRLLSIEKSIEIYRQTAFILTSYLDLADYREIFPWHHAAGDFVAKVGADVQVKLVTVRQYVPRIQSEKDFKLDAHEAALLFFCNLTIRNRVDRIDGIGAMVWSPAWLLVATVQGFFDALASNEDRGIIESGFSSRLKFICKKLDLIAWTQLFDGTLSSFNNEAPDFDLIENNLPEHIFEVYQLFSKS